MKLLCVASTLNFPNFTRRATIEAIWRQNPDTELLMFTGLKTIGKRHVSITGLETGLYRFWTPEKLKSTPVISGIEPLLRKPRCKASMNRFEVVFLTDPNEYLLLPYLNGQKVVYLIRDPNVLQSQKNHAKEKVILQRADTVLATSRNLAERYLPEYYGFQHPNIHYWPNTVDLDIWDYDKYQKYSSHEEIFTVGMAGNLGLKRTDFELLDYLTDQCPEIQFDIAGNVEPAAFEKTNLKTIFERKNVRYLGFIPFDDLPKTVMKWKSGLIIEAQNEYASYMHHNKIYQYLALGKPVVVLRTHADYDNYPEPVYVCHTKEEYSKRLKQLSESNVSMQSVQMAIALARENSNEMRAQQFFSAISQK